jgi:hypothetical protein
MDQTLHPAGQGGSSWQNLNPEKKPLILRHKINTAGMFDFLILPAIASFFIFIPKPILPAEPSRLKVCGTHWKNSLAEILRPSESVRIHRKSKRSLTISLTWGFLCSPIRTIELPRHTGFGERKRCTGKPLWGLSARLFLLTKAGRSRKPGIRSAPRTPRLN